MKIIIILLVLTITSCSQNNEVQKVYNNNIKTYQYHDKDITDFSFLSRYNNLEALDLSGTNVKDLSFLKKLKRLKTLVLININFDELILSINKDVILYEGIHHLATPLSYIDFYFSFEEIQSGKASLELGL